MTPVYTSTLPREVDEFEKLLIRERRSVLPPEPVKPEAEADGGRSPSSRAKGSSKSGAASPTAATVGAASAAAAENTTAPAQERPLAGLALSGGGIRSATFCLGFIQAMAGRGLLRHIDYLSTVSGGGYTGGFLGRFFTRYQNAPQGAAALLEKELADSQSAPLRWLRQNARYLAPSGRNDWLQNFAWYFRNLISVWFTLGLLLFGLFLLITAARQSSAWLDVAPVTSALRGLRDSLPILGQSRWLLVPAVILMLCVLPLIWSFWLARRGEELLPHTANPRRIFDTPVQWGMLTMLVATVTGGSLTHGAVRAGLWAMALPLLISFPLTFAVRWYLEKYDGKSGPSLQTALRASLSQWLAVFLGLLAGSLYFVVVDGLGSHIAQNGFGKITAFVAAAFTVLPGIMMKALVFFRGSSPEGPKKGSRQKLGIPLGLLAVVAGSLLLTAVLAVVAGAAHRVCNASLTAAWWTAAAALVISLIFSGAWTFLNQSSLQNMYSSRLARLWLGATNPRRREGAGASVSEVVTGDDTLLSDYQPWKFGGPLHIINVTINETSDGSTQREIADRKGLGMSAGPWGLTVGRSHFAQWHRPDGTVLPLRKPEGVFHPLDSEETPRYLPARDPDGDYRFYSRAAQNIFYGWLVRRISGLPWVRNTARDSVGGRGVPSESLTLRYWLGISGAAFTTGTGARTNKGLSLLAGLAGVRLGWWWDSAIHSKWRPGVRRPSWPRRLLQLPSKIFPMQSVILSELGGSFSGPSKRLWYLSDGGHFENTGLYELIRRRVPLMICCDCGADPKYQLADLANLVRKARMDFGAEIRFLSESELARFLEPELCSVIGPVEKLATLSASDPEASTGQHHAALAAVYYDNSAEPSSLLLLVKPSLSGDEPADVINYAREHEDFPQQPTVDQIFDEAQWESYRRLGEHIGVRLFTKYSGGPGEKWQPCKMDVSGLSTTLHRSDRPASASSAVFVKSMSVIEPAGGPDLSQGMPPVTTIASATFADTAIPPQ